MEERINNLETLIIANNEIKKETEEKKFIFESEILKKEEQDMIINWLPKKPHKINLLLNLNKDEDSKPTFMNKFSGKSPSLCVVKTTNGFIFGGYTTQIWKDGKIKDNNAFVFSINNKKNIKLKNLNLQLAQIVIVYGF